MDKENFNRFIVFLADLLAIEQPGVYFRQDGIAGEAAPEENTISYNLDVISDWITLYFVAAHEMYHLYQYLEGGVDMAKYVQHIDNREGYLQQDIEVESNAFGYFIMAKVFGIEMKMNGLDVENYAKKFAKAVDLISEEFLESEIQESLRYSGFKKPHLLELGLSPKATIDNVA